MAPGWPLQRLALHPQPPQEIVAGMLGDKLPVRYAPPCCRIRVSFRDHTFWLIVRLQALPPSQTIWFVNPEVPVPSGD